MDVPGRRAEEAELRADPFVQLRLLDVQELDTAIAALDHQRAHPPEAPHIEELVRRRRQVDDRVRDLRVTVADLTEEQQKADRDVDSVRSRRERDQRLVDSGSVKDPKDLAGLVHEIESLQRRIGDLEDAEIEVMERLEQAQADLAAGEEELAAINAEGRRLVAARDERLASLGQERTQLSGRRTDTAAGVPADLLALYDRLREAKGGVGVAALRARQCGGCRLTLDASILRDIAAAPSDQVLRCEECDRILVRTGESGL